LISLSSPSIAALTSARALEILLNDWRRLRESIITAM
uniref:IclR family transcriptional regulator n=1 Tax=Anisakis simplex TaxID=6269 RepID=A0A0M3JKI9_ANISI